MLISCLLGAAAEADAIGRAAAEASKAACMLY